MVFLEKKTDFSFLVDREELESEMARGSDDKNSGGMHVGELKIRVNFESGTFFDLPTTVKIRGDQFGVTFRGGYLDEKDTFLRQSLIDFSYNCFQEALKDL